MREIPLTQNKTALVDDEDYEMLSLINWHADKHRNTFYARGHRSPGAKTGYKMHRLILGLTDPKQLVDHIDGNGLNNQKSNLRIVTNSQNCMNRSYAPKNSKTGIKGVCWDNKMRRWVAYIKVNGKMKYLGCSQDIKEAAKKRQEAERKYHGEYARQYRQIETCALD